MADIMQGLRGCAEKWTGLRGLLRTTAWGLIPRESEWTPAMNVVETEDQVVMKAEVPGSDPKDINISLSRDALTVK